MTGTLGHRVYLDWNATAPLRPEARDAMLAAMDVVGNPSSVHAEGRAARAIVEKARGQVAALVGCEPDEVVFTSGATEAAAIWFYDKDSVCGTHIEHDAVWQQLAASAFHRFFDCESSGVLSKEAVDIEGTELSALQTANSETGVMQPLVDELPIGVTDATQTLGKTRFEFARCGARAAVMSAHKFGGPKGVGALVVRSGHEPYSPLSGQFSGYAGAGQEKGRRSGTENVIGIAGFGAAAEAAQHDLEAGVWDRVERLRNSLEERLEAVAPDLIIFGREAPRLPNTSCFAVPGWAGETQVIALDLAGFAVSAGSACSSGKVKRASRVLMAMGFDEATASSAIRVSMGPATTEAEVMAFADAWAGLYRRRASRAA